MSIKAPQTLLVFLFNILCLTTIPAYAAVKNYIRYDLDYKPFETQRLNLEKQIGKPLKNRGEAHITVITPPEFVILSKYLKPEQIHKLANESLVKKPKYEQICLGAGRLMIAQHEEQTYFVVVASNELLQIRHKLANAAKAPVEKFNPDLFFPHITLGFTARDLHYEDGLIKDQSLCLKK